MLHISPAVFGAGGVVGGAERYAYELARHMADRVPTTLVAFGPERDVKMEGKLTVEVVPADGVTLDASFKLRFASITK